MQDARLRVTGRRRQRSVRLTTQQFTKLDHSGFPEETRPRRRNFLSRGLAQPAAVEQLRTNLLVGPASAMKARMLESTSPGPYECGSGHQGQLEGSGYGASTGNPAPHALWFTAHRMLPSVADGMGPRHRSLEQHWLALKQRNGQSAPRAIRSTKVMLRLLKRNKGSFGVVPEEAAKAAGKDVRILFTFP